MSTVTGEYSPEALRAVLIGLGLASQFDVQVCEALCDAEPGPGGSYSLKELMAVMRKAGMPATLVMDVRARLLQPTPPVSAGAEEASAGAVSALAGIWQHLYMFLLS